MTSSTRAIAAQNTSDDLAAITIERRDLLEHDVRIDIAFAGICHSDIHSVKGDWGPMHFPLVPGHEIVGHVVEVGSGVTAHAVGDLVGVGVIVKSCGECANCLADLENYCNKGALLTFGDPDPDLPGHITQGGYSQSIVITEKFVLRVPKNLDPASVAPLLCAGITVYSPLKHWGVGPGMTVGVAGIGGLGHMAVKFAHALGAHVVAMTTSESKVALAKSLGADEVLVTRDADAMKASRDRFDVIISTLPGDHDMNPFIQLLTFGGTYVVVGAINDMTHPLNLPAIISRRKSIAGSNIGGLKETQEMLDFAGEHGIAADIELISAEYVNEAYKRVVAGDVQFRFVIDTATIPGA
jgi:uncharacterized zinc-type alcohol dehydrogenase-like protein